MQVGLVDWDLAKNYGAEIALKADVKETLRALMPALKAAGGAALEARAKQGLAALASKNWTAQAQAAGRADIESTRARSPIDPDWLALQVVEAMPDNAILVDEGLTSSRQMHRAAAASRPLRLSRAGLRRHRLGTAGLRRRQPRQSGPAGGVLTPATAARCIRSSRCGPQRNHKLPLTFVIVNNGGYRIIKQRLLAFHGDDHYVGMDFIDPPVDFTGVAKSLGLEATRVTDPGPVEVACCHRRSAGRARS